MALITQNDQPLPLGSTIPEFTLEDTTRRHVGTKTLSGGRGAVVFFTCNHCPYVRGYEDRFLSLARLTMPRGLNWLGINPNAAHPNYPDDSITEMEARVKEKQYPFPYAADLEQTVARAFGAACTPEFFLFDASRRLAFTGRLDDEMEASRATRHYLADACEDVIAGRPVAVPKAHPIGCSIKWI